MRESGKGLPRRSHSNKYVNKIWSNPRGRAQEHKGGVSVLGQVESKEPSGLGQGAERRWVSVDSSELGFLCKRPLWRALPHRP